MRSMTWAAAAAALAVLAGCSTYKATPQMNYYHGQNVPEGFITVVKASTAEITFEIRVDFKGYDRLYHLVLDGNTPVSEGWFRTLKTTGAGYTVTMAPKKGLAYEPGKTYRLCIGTQNPEAVQMSSNNYPCMADFVFVFQEKS